LGRLCFVCYTGNFRFFYVWIFPIFKRKKTKLSKLFFIGYCVLALYSTNCTVAGQYWDQQIKKQEINTFVIDKENTFFLIKSYEEKIKNLQNEYDNLNEIRDNSLNDLSDLYNWKNTTQTLEEMKKAIKAELKEYENKLEKVLSENKVSVKNQNEIKMSKTLYIFYANIFNMKTETDDEKIQFIFKFFYRV
jgi:hypothetical protein